MSAPLGVSKHGWAELGGRVFQHDQLAVLVDGRLFDIEGYVHLAGTLTEGAIVGVGVLPDVTSASPASAVMELG